MMWIRAALIASMATIAGLAHAQLTLTGAGGGGGGAGPPAQSEPIPVLFGKM